MESVSTREAAWPPPDCPPIYFYLLSTEHAPLLLHEQTINAPPYNMYVREVVSLRQQLGSVLSDDNVYDHINSYFRHYSSFRVVIDEWDANGNLDGCVDFFRRTIIYPEGWLMAVEYAGTSFGIRYTFSYTTSKKAEHETMRYYLGRAELLEVYSTYEFWFH